jgi:hypothetical protein
MKDMPAALLAVLSMGDVAERLGSSRRQWSEDLISCRSSQSGVVRRDWMFFPVA